MIHIRGIKPFLLLQFMLCFIVLSGYIMIAFFDDNSVLTTMFIPMFVMGLFIVPFLTSIFFQLIFKLSVKNMVKLGIIKAILGILVTLIIFICEYSIDRLIIRNILLPLPYLIAIGAFLFLTFMFGSVIAFVFQSIASKIKANF